MDRDFDEETFELYASALADPDPGVRGGAVLGSAYLGWPQLAGPLRALANDPDVSIRNDDALLLSRLSP